MNKEALLKNIDEMLHIQYDSNNNDYMRGMYNGMEFIRSLVSHGEPVYQEKDGSLDLQAAERNPERYI